MKKTIIKLLLLLITSSIYADENTLNVKTSSGSISVLNSGDLEIAEEIAKTNSEMKIEFDDEHEIYLYATIDNEEYVFDGWHGIQNDGSDEILSYENPMLVDKEMFSKYELIYSKHDINAYLKENVNITPKNSEIRIYERFINEANIATLGSASIWKYNETYYNALINSLKRQNPLYTKRIERK